MLNYGIFVRENPAAPWRCYVEGLTEPDAETLYAELPPDLAPLADVRLIDPRREARV